MTGYNLPPGVTEDMLPGNRPEDEEDERFWNALYEALIRTGRNRDPRTDRAVELMEADLSVGDGAALDLIVSEARRIAYDQGFAEGRDEAASA